VHAYLLVSTEGNTKICGYRIELSVVITACELFLCYVSSVYVVQLVVLLCIGLYSLCEVHLQTVRCCCYGDSLVL